MSTPSKKPADAVVQELLAERRRLMVSNERLKLELEEARSAPATMTPPAQDIALEVARLQGMLETTRAEVEVLARERDALVEGIQRALDQLRQNQK